MSSACEAAGLVMPKLLDAALAAIASPSVRGVIDDALFYCGVREFVIDNIVVGPYRELVAVKLAKALSALSMVIVTLWVAIQGFNFISGQGKQAVLPALYQTGKLVLVLSLVSLLAKESPFVIEAVENFKNLISHAVADGSSVTTLIDVNLGITAMLSSINDAIRSVESQRDPNLITSTVGLLGQSGPAMLTGTLLLLTELSVTLAIMLAPLFIFFLIFQQTAQLFWSWAKFLLGALFSLATLTLVASLALQATALYGATVVAAFYTNSGDGLGGMINAFAGGPFDINASSLRLAALGTLMTAIIVSVPPVIMGFFGGAAAFTTGAMVSMGGAGMMAQQLGAGKSAGTGAPALGQSAGASGGGGGAGASTASGGALSPAQQSPAGLEARGSRAFSVGDEAPSSAQHTLQHVGNRMGPVDDMTDAGTKQDGSTPPGGGRVGLAPQLAGADRPDAPGGLGWVQTRQQDLLQAQELNFNHKTGVYEPSTSHAALNAPNSTLGRGGKLHVSGSQGATGAAAAGEGSGTGSRHDTPTHMANGSQRAAASEGAAKRPVPPQGRGNNRPESA